MRIIDLPIHKRILNTTYTVDSFKIQVEDCSHYFLSHFHADHYNGLNTKFPYEIYCSHTTSNLLVLKYKVKTKPLEMYKVYNLLNGDTVMCIDAYHCPGAVCFIFRIEGEFVLHTGDFRSTESFLEQIQFINQFSTDNLQFGTDNLQFSTVYLDNTYEGFRTFGSQKDSICRIIKIIQDKYAHTCLVPIKYVFMFCTYSVGKEKIFLCAGEFFNKSLRVTKEKKKIYDCFDEYSKEKLNKEVISMVEEIKKDLEIKRNLEIKNRHCGSKDYDSKHYDSKHPSREGFFSNVIFKEINQNYYNNHKIYKTPFSRITIEDDSINNNINYSTNDQFVVISTTQLEKKKLNKLLLGNKADRVIVFCGTGWKDTVKYFDWIREDGRVVKKGIEVHYIPYSEHSSSDELVKFKDVVKTEKIINTVKQKHTY